MKYTILLQDYSLPKTITSYPVLFDASCLTTQSLTFLVILHQPQLLYYASHIIKLQYGKPYIIAILLLPESVITLSAAGYCH